MGGGVGLLVRHTLAKSVTTLIGQHANVCAESDPKDIHEFRATVRRLPCELRTFAPLLEDSVTTWLCDELLWLGSEVAVVCDADLLVERLRSQLARLPDQDAKQLGTLSQHLAEARTDAFEHVVATLAEDRYVALLDALVGIARAPQFASQPSGLADRRGRPISIGIADEAWRNLSRAVDSLVIDAPDDAYRAIRGLSQDARYAADAVAPLNGKDSRRFARALADVESVLEEYQDSTLAEAWCRGAAKALLSTRLVAGELIGFERDDRVQLRAQFEKVWKKTSRRKLRKWLT